MYLNCLHNISGVDITLSFVFLVVTLLKDLIKLSVDISDTDMW